LSDQARRRGGGSYDAPWALAASLIVSSNSRENTNKMAKDFATVFRTMMLTNKSLGHPEAVMGLTWVTERYDQVPLNPKDTRTLNAATMVFEIEVRDVASDNGVPPSVPPDDPYTPPPATGEIITTTHDIRKKS
jgi:D-mannonate dehydratase